MDYIDFNGERLNAARQAAADEKRRYFVYATMSVRDIGDYFPAWEVWHVGDNSGLCECSSEDIAVTICKALEEYAGGEATIAPTDSPACAGEE